MDDSIEPAEPPLKPIRARKVAKQSLGLVSKHQRKRRVCPHGAQCLHCGVLATGRTVFTQRNGKPHPYPHRHFGCKNDHCPFLRSKENDARVRDGLNRRRYCWNVTIPSQQLIVDKPEPVPA